MVICSVLKQDFVGMACFGIVNVNYTGFWGINFDKLPLKPPLPRLLKGIKSPCSMMCLLVFCLFVKEIEEICAQSRNRSQC